MATYQEQLARLQERKAVKGEESFELIAEAIADAMTPRVTAGLLTLEQASSLMTEIVLNLQKEARGRKQ